MDDESHVLATPISVQPKYRFVERKQCDGHV